MPRYKSLEELVRDAHWEQDARRTTGAFGEWPPEELYACKQLAYELYGDNGVVEFLPDKRLGLGMFTDGKGAIRPEAGEPPRPTRMIFVGRSHADLAEQVKLARASAFSVGGNA